jgi:hypothetical protein
MVGVLPHSKLRNVPESNRFLALSAAVATVLAVFGLLTHFKASPRFDTFTLLLIGGTTGAVAVLMLIFTRRWSIRALGVLCQMVADCLLYGGAGLAELGWIHPLAQDPQRQNLIRSLFIVGSLGILIGVLIYLWTKWRAPGPTHLVDYDVPEAAL